LATPIFTFMLTRQLIKFNYSTAVGGGQLLILVGDSPGTSGSAFARCGGHLH